MHSLFLTHWYPTESNPVYGTFIREHARAVALYHKVTVIHIQGIDETNPSVSREEDGTLTVYRLRYPKPRIPKTGWWYRWRGVFNIVANLVNEQPPPDIIHAQVYHNADLAYFLRQIHHLPAVLTEHSTEFPRNCFTRWQIIKNRYFLNHIDLISPVSVDLGLHILNQGIYTPQKTLPSPVDANLFHPPNISTTNAYRVKRILCVASLIPRKGLDYLIRAFYHLRETRADIKLIIIGSGFARESLEALSRELNLLDSIEFLGEKSKSEVAEYMRRSDLLVLTSFIENLPSVILEAFVSGLPVVATSVGGIPEVVKPFCGCLVEPGRVEKIFEKMAFVLDHIEQFPSRKIAEYGFSEFSFHAIGKRQTEIYQAVIREFKRSR